MRSIFASKAGEFMCDQLYAFKSSSGMPALRQISSGARSVNFATSFTMFRAA